MNSLLERLVVSSLEPPFYGKNTKTPPRIPNATGASKGAEGQQEDSRGDQMDRGDGGGKVIGGNLFKKAEQLGEFV